ncbi:CPBP family intramembrane glutamic endopeptidase [Protaetiibacter mangrovi]|uniref:CPBP family intramembrane metalloprotease n=1 Tax=Protaetiibacter mangrovi TaxID=2970926 RepID=A0ABT1ZDX0_9MICO|nr:CPBP family intramembrane glutamic endopeptidase [Protaetiibacter mangrovi]MCS0498899.1 CPBP family intramembrane metalloprotease [Protaetiibacter mangrovi]TPX04613.1 CPBP family intramembrane metalloprotease [Schumannella luteola]
MALQLLALLLVIVALLVWRAVSRERREYAQFKRMRATSSRQKVMRRWLVESVLVFGGLSAAVLLAAWEYVPQVLRDGQAWEPIAASRAFFLDSPLGRGIAIGAAVGVLVALVLPVLLLRRASPDDVPKLGDIGALLPRTRGELPYGAGLALSAGVFEELMFRLALPALLFGIWPDGPVAFALSTLLFGALHLYQRWVGVLTATALGAIFAYLYLVSGTILLPIAVHAIVDLRSLVLLPLVIGKVWSTRS